MSLYLPWVYAAHFCSSRGPLYVAPSPRDLFPSPTEHLLRCRIPLEDLLSLIQLLQLDHGSWSWLSRQLVAS